MIQVQTDGHTYACDLTLDLDNLEPRSKADNVDPQVCQVGMGHREGKGVALRGQFKAK